MKKWVLSFLMVMVLITAGDVWAKTLYLCEGGNGSAPTTGACATAFDGSDFSTAGNWGVGGNQIAAGDVVSVLDDGGAISEVLTFRGSGTAGNPITLRGENAATSVAVNGANCINVNVNTYVNIEDLTVSGSTTTAIRATGNLATSTAGYLNIDNVTCTETAGDTCIAVSSYGNSSYTNLNLTITGAAEADGSFGLNLTWDAAHRPTTITIDNITATGGDTPYYVGYSDNVTASNITASGGVDTDQNGSIYYQALGGTNSITDQTITSGADACIVLRTITGTLTLNNITASGCDDGGLDLVDVSATLAADITGLNISNLTGTGIRLANTDSMTIDGAVIHDLATADPIFGTGIQIGNPAGGGGTSDSNVIENSKIYSCSWDGISLKGAGANNIIQGNNVYNVGSNAAGAGQPFTSHNTMTGTIIRYNDFHDSWRGLGVGASGMQTGAVYNNRIVNNGRATSDEYMNGGWVDVCTDPNCGAWTLKYNMFKNNYPVEINLTANAATASGATIDFNQYIHTGNGVTEAEFACVTQAGDPLTTIPWATYKATYEANSMYFAPHTYTQGEKVKATMFDENGDLVTGKARIK